jgi:hypothetical protein
MSEEDHKISLMIEAELSLNPPLLAMEANKNKARFSYESYADFLEKQLEYITTPRKLVTPICYDDNPLKKRVFAEVSQQLKLKHKQEVTLYESKKATQDRLNQYPQNEKGYAQYLTENHADSLSFLIRRHLIPISERNRQLHTYITGGTGSGKSEVIKSLIWHYLTRHTSTGIVLLTPHGKIAQEVGRFKENVKSERLVYIDPMIDGVHFPCINPFDIDGKENLTDIEAEHYAEEFRLIFEELLKGEFTEQMNALLMNTLPVLIKLPDASIYDLLDFLDPSNDNEKAHFYIDFAMQNFQNKNILNFLNGQFLTDNSYNRTKSGLHTRLNTIFSSTIMQAIFAGKSTLDIALLMNQKKLIVFNVSKGKLRLEWLVIGKMIAAKLKLISFSREKINEWEIIPCHFFIDECQNYITPTIQEILEESRKFGLFLTLAQQNAGAGMDDRLFKSILGNTGVKLTGRNGDDSTLATMAVSTKTTLEELQDRLATGRFSLWQSALTGQVQKPPVIVTMPKNTINDTNSMTDNEWEALKNAQIRQYYRIPEVHSPRPIITPPEAEKPVKNESNQGRKNARTNTGNQERKKPTPEPQAKAEKSQKIDGFDLSDYLN